MLTDIITGPSLFAVVLLTAVLLAMGRRSRLRPPAPAINLTGGATAEQFEEVSGRVDTTLASLDLLITEADAEIARLENLLDETAEKLPLERVRSTRRLQPRDRPMVRHLLAAGFSVTEVARLAGVDIAEVSRLWYGDPGFAA